jgi:hypothetical protein
LNINHTLHSAVCEGRGNESLERLVVAAIRNRIERPDLPDWPEKRIVGILRQRYRTRISPDGVVLMGVAPKKFKGMSARPFHVADNK